MADKDTASAARTVELDAEGKRLQLDAEKAKYLEAIVKSQQSVAEAKSAPLKSLLPTVSDAPKGQTELGDKAGALGPWRAHQIIDAVAQQIADQVSERISGLTPRVLVVGDRSLLESDWTARQVREALERQNRRILALKAQIGAGAEKLAERIKHYESEPNKPLQNPAESTEGRRRTVSEEPAGTTTAISAGAGSVNAFGSAIDLIGLLRTDYTLTASTVTAGPSELATLTAGHLGRKHAVEADLFSTRRPSPSTRSLGMLLNTRDDVVEALSNLQQTLTPVESELAAIRSKLAVLDQEWAKAAADEDVGTVPDRVRQAAEALAQQARLREQAGGPARTLVAHAKLEIAEVDAAVAALLQAPESGEAPIFTAARYERLEERDGVENVITHVLYVSLDTLAADVVTRRSVLGASGVLQFLTAGNASWLLLDTATGTIVDGGQKGLADVLTFGLGTGEATFGDNLGLKKVDKVTDPLAALEHPAKALVVALAVVLVVLGIISMIAVIRVATG